MCAFTWANFCTLKLCNGCSVNNNWIIEFLSSIMECIVWFISYSSRVECLQIWWREYLISYMSSNLIYYYT